MSRKLASLSLLALSLGWSVPAFPQQPAWFAALQQKLSQVYLTRASKDVTTILEPGTKFVLKKGGMGMARAIPGRLNLLISSNSYVNGAIKPQFSTLLQHQVEQGTAMIVPAGEKVWVASFGPVKNDLEVLLVTDLYRLTLANGAFADQFHVDGARFWGILKFPLPKGSPPDPDQILASMQEVLAPEDSSPAAFCNALVKLKSTVPFTIVEDTVLPNGEPPDVQGELANTDALHYESLVLPGDHVQQIHATVQSCLPGLTLEEPITLVEGLYRSTLSGVDPPYNISFTVVSKLNEAGNTSVGIYFKRIENEALARLDNAAIAYVAVAVDTCGWSLQTPAQTQNINRLLGNRTGSFQDELNFANKHVADVGRLDFCSDPKERAKFDRLVPTLWPVGTAGRP